MRLCRNQDWRDLQDFAFARLALFVSSGKPAKSRFWRNAPPPRKRVKGICRPNFSQISHMRPIACAAVLLKSRLSGLDFGEGGSRL